jgi:hypothetical protein
MFKRKERDLFKKSDPVETSVLAQLPEENCKRIFLIEIMLDIL